MAVLVLSAAGIAAAVVSRVSRSGRPASFPAGIHTGTRTVTVTGTYDGRTTTKTYKVTS